MSLKAIVKLIKKSLVEHHQKSHLLECAECANSVFNKVLWKKKPPTSLRASISKLILTETGTYIHTTYK